jgi:hypothetical protein
MKTKNVLLLFFFLFLSTGYSQSLINTKHLDHLYEEIHAGNAQIGIVHIYAEYPDYHYVDAEGEGITCVDDIARAAVFYEKYYHMGKNVQAYHKITAMARFLVLVQNQNGFYNNFIFRNGTVNTTFRTSIAEPNWWSWRAMWSLASIYETVKAQDPLLADSILQSLHKAVVTVLPLYGKNDKYKEYDGFKIPDWLPAENGADQAAVLVKALCKYHAITSDTTVIPLIKSLCAGILAMQVNDAGSFYNGTFLSWRNSWHAWGNSQADALLDAYVILKDKKYLSSALKEINLWYPRLMKAGYLTELSLQKQGKAVHEIKKQKFSQIAYGIRPMVFSCVNAYRITGNKKYLKQGIAIAGWLFGNNPTGQKIYSVEAGTCYDGINDEKSLNKNSGAESTIEALLALMSLESIPAGAKMLNQSYGK